MTRQIETSMNAGVRPTNPLNNIQNAVAFTGHNGVPLGGIGAGCVELLPDGRLANFTTCNNFHRHQRIEFMPGSMFAFAASDGRVKTLRLLQSQSTLPLGQTGRTLLLGDDQIEHEGLYPAARLRYEIDGLPLELTLHAHGYVVPGDLRRSCMPAASFRFSVANLGARPIRATLAFSWENIAGCMHGVFPDGRDRISKIDHDGELVGLRFESPDGCRENQRGSHVIHLDGVEGGEVTAARFNTWEVSPLLGQLEDRGRFDAEAWDRRFSADAEFSGALACSVEVAPGETRDVGFVLAWYFPDFKVGRSELRGKETSVDDQGHQYAAHFDSVDAVAAEAIDCREDTARAIDAWHDSLVHSSLPDWLSYMLINQLSVLTQGTLWARDGRYSLMETPFGPMMGTLDQRFYSSVATALLFPELERTELELFARTKHPADAGRVYHDLGNLRFDDPKTGTTAKNWTDLNPKFVLMTLRNYRWTGDRDELEKLWAYMVDMMRYTASQDTDDDGLPNNEDRSTTYDDWAFFGANSYSSSLWLAALRAFREMAAELGREDDWRPFEPILAKATEQFEARLWDDQLGYYRLYNDDRNPVFDRAAEVTEADASGSLADPSVNQGQVPTEAQADHPKVNRTCHDGQLAGQWYADLLDLGPLVEPARIVSAMRQIAARSATPRGVHKGISPEGDESPNPPSSRWWSEAGQGWPGYEAGHFAALAIHEGLVDEGLTALRRVYDEVHERAAQSWNWPLRWNLESGGSYGWGCDRYMNAPSIWFACLALAGVLLDRPNEALALRPRMLPGREVLDLPVFTPGNRGRLCVEERAEGRRIVLSFEMPEPLRALTLELGRFRRFDIRRPEVSYETQDVSVAGRGDERRVVFAEPVTIDAEGLVVELA